MFLSSSVINLLCVLQLGGLPPLCVGFTTLQDILSFVMISSFFSGEAVSTSWVLVWVGCTSCVSCLPYLGICTVARHCKWWLLQPLSQTRGLTQGYQPLSQTRGLTQGYQPTGISFEAHTIVNQNRSSKAFRYWSSVPDSSSGCKAKFLCWLHRNPYSFRDASLTSEDCLQPQRQGLLGPTAWFLYHEQSVPLQECLFDHQK